MTQLIKFTGKDGKPYRAEYLDTGELAAIAHWRCASYRTGRYHWVTVWPRWSRSECYQPFPKGIGEVPKLGSSQ